MWKGGLSDIDMFSVVMSALDHDDVLYLKEQLAAEQDAERMRTHNEKRAFLAFKISFHGYFGSVWREHNVPNQI